MEVLLRNFFAFYVVIFFVEVIIAVNVGPHVFKCLSLDSATWPELNNTLDEMNT